jgi:hypothetical protein
LFGADPKLIIGLNGKPRSYRCLSFIAIHSVAAEKEGEGYKGHPCPEENKAL